MSYPQRPQKPHKQQQDNSDIDMTKYPQQTNEQMQNMNYYPPDANNAQQGGYSPQGVPYSQSGAPYAPQGGSYSQAGNNDPNLNLPIEEQIRQQVYAKKKKRNKILLILLIVVVSVSLLGVLLYFIGTGRISSKVTTLEAEVASLQERYASMEAEKDETIADLHTQIEDTTIKELVPTTSLQRVEGSEVPELWLREGDFIAPNALNIPLTTDSVNDSYIQIGTKYVFRPSERWLMTSQGSTYEFSHPQHIWGKIRAMTASDNVVASDRQIVIQNFFLGYPATTIKYRKLFIDDRAVGIIGDAKVTVQYETDATEDVEVPVETVVDVPYEVEEEVEVDVPYIEKVTNADGTISEVEKTKKEKQKQKVVKTEKKTVTIMQKQTNSVKGTAEKDIIINVGFIQKNEETLSFLFVYNADGGSVSQELVDSLLKTGSFGHSGSSIKIE